MLGGDVALAPPRPERATPEAAAPEEETVADDADWPEAGPARPGVAYEESFDWSMDNEEAVREWESKGWQIGFDVTGNWTGEVSDGVYRLSNRRHESGLYTQMLSFGGPRADSNCSTEPRSTASSGGGSTSCASPDVRTPSSCGSTASC